MAAAVRATGQLREFIVPIALLFAAALVFWLAPDQLGLATRIIIMVLFVLSLDLVVGYAGVATLGHAAMYGTGAYAAGLFAIHVSPDPLIGLGLSGLAGAAIAFLSGLVVLRARGLTALMLTILIALTLQDIATRAHDITGGTDGLAGVDMAPILGRFAFDFAGMTGYWYAVAVLLIALIFMQRLVRSPFGLTIRGIHENPDRMRALGAPVYWHLVTLYTIAGLIAGLAGALSAQINAIVGTDVFNFSLSAEALIMLALGGVGRLWGGFAGVIVFMLVHHFGAAIDPFNWLFLIGALVLGVVFFAPAGLISLGAVFGPVAGIGRRS